jgi:inorganic pyrophosphatase
MNLDRVSTGEDVPNDINVIIEIPSHADPVKYEVDKASGAMFVDRFMNTAMHYPVNYGYVPHTLYGDGDPVDVLVVTPLPLCRIATGRGRRVEDDRRSRRRREADRGAGAQVWRLRPHHRHRAGLPALARPHSHFFEHYKDWRASGSNSTASAAREAGDPADRSALREQHGQAELTPACSTTQPPQGGFCFRTQPLSPIRCCRCASARLSACTATRPIMVCAAARR